MPLGAAAASMRSVSGAAGAPPFSIPAPFTAATAVATLQLSSNAATFGVGDGLLLMSGYGNDANPPFVSFPSGDWPSPPTFSWVTEDGILNVPGARSISMGIFEATADSAQVGQTARIEWSSSADTAGVGLCVVGGGFVIGQESPVAKKDEGEGTTLDCVLDAPPAASSLLIMVAAARNNAAFAGPPGWTVLTNVSASTAHRFQVFAQTGVTTQTHGLTGLSNSAVAIAQLLELTR